jgi:RNA polymerase sigma factor (sigma-70 family)
VTAASRRAESPGVPPPSALPADGLDAESLYRDHYMRLVRLARSLGADEAMAEDAVQATFATAVSRLENRHDISNALAYLCVAVRHEVARLSRRRARETPAPEEWLIAWAGSKTYDSHLLHESPAYEAAQSLPARQRTVLALIVDGYEPSEIAEILGTQETTVRVHLHAARKRAQASLSRKEHQAADVTIRKKVQASLSREEHRVADAA